MSALQWIFYKLPEYLTTYFSLDKRQVNSIQEFTRKIAATTTFDELYKLLGFTYVINPAGDLDSFEDESFDLVFSFDVLEHIRSENLCDSIASYYRILKSGGYSVHQIGLDDHLTHYDRRASRKQFLSYSEFDWKLRFENQIQYFNRIPCSEFLTLFENCGFKRIKLSVLREPESIRDLSISKQYKDLSWEDLEATRAMLVHQKLAQTNE